MAVQDRFDSVEKQQLEAWNLYKKKGFIKDRKFSIKKKSENTDSRILYTSIKCEEN